MDNTLDIKSTSTSLELPQPYLLFLGDISEPEHAKTAFGLYDWAPEYCIGEFACSSGSVSVGLPAMSPKVAKSNGARALVIGIANPGGVISESWIKPLQEAIAAGLHIVSGMHARLEDVPALREIAVLFDRKLINVRQPPSNIPVASGRRRGGKRLLTVGTDCALGKKYTALAIARSMASRGIDVDFRATGQTGIMIAGSGIPLDAVVADFASGAVELLAPDASNEHWDVIEGQGSLFHPAYAGVSLSLLHGSQADVFVVCHDPRRSSMLGYPEFLLPTVEETIDLTLRLGQRTNPEIRCGGVSLNTKGLSEAEAQLVIDETSIRLSVPVADPIRGGDSYERLVDACIA